jgi:site-specific DNA-methyltransferase (adenine-specific)
MSNQITNLPITELQPHPRNPRLVMREDVIMSIQAGLSGGFLPCYALQVWPINGTYQVLSGHHRLEAAKRAGLTEAPCFVRDDIDEDQAYMVLATANAQGELSPLEIGCHAYGLGHGSAKDYAAAVGVDAGYLSRVKNAYEVLKLTQVNFPDVKDKANHLAAIHKLPRECWGIAAKVMMRGDKSAKDTAAFVENWKQCFEAVKETGWLEGVNESGESILAELLAADEMTLATIRRCLGTLEDIKALVEKNSIDAEPLQAFLASSPKTHRQFVEFQQELLASLFESKSSWNLGRWQDHLEKLEDGSVSLVLTDPPYGMEYRSNYRKERHEAIEGDDSTDAFLESLEAMISKMKDNAHLLAFVNWKNETEFIRACEKCGLAVKSSIVWVKNNTGMGDLDGAFAPKHERIIHAVKGSPKLFTRTADVIECARVDSSRHPTEKPTQLLRLLIEACTVKGQLVADPFGGVASVAVAAKESGRDYWACEINEKYFRHGEGRLEA